MSEFTSVSAGTVASSRVRLARNLNGYLFPSRMTSEKQAKEIIRSVSYAVNKLDEFKLLYMDGITEEEALNLVENHLISPLLLQRPSFSAALINERKNVSIMINEEDHLREQCILKGFSLDAAYNTMNEKDELMSRSLKFAFDEQLGFLTACPTNLGTGLRASVMMFLPALTINGLMPMLIQKVTRLGLTIRGIYGEGSAAKGYMYQVSNEVTLGETEEYIIKLVKDVVDKIAELELAERIKLKRGVQMASIKDKCLRAFGVVTNCALMTSEEFEKLCADVKLGACLGYINIPDVTAVDDVVISLKPSNINLLADRQLTTAERDAYRADYGSKKILNLVQ